MPSSFRQQQEHPKGCGSCEGKRDQSDRADRSRRRKSGNDSRCGCESSGNRDIHDPGTASSCLPLLVHDAGRQVFWRKSLTIGKRTFNSQVLRKYTEWYRNKWIHRGGINKEFSFISQNCAGGIIYHSLHRQFTTPTINLTIEGEDFVKFVEHLDYYLLI